jgi:hypothetical protein
VDARYDTEIQRGISLAMQQEYDSAIHIFKEMTAKDPEYPAGYFFLMSVIVARFYDMNDTSSLPLFKANSDRILEITRDKTDSIFRFYQAATYGFMSIMTARQGKRLQGALLGRKAGKIYETLVEDGITSGDVDGLLGSYHYWISVAFKKLHWLPFIEDKRDIGMGELSRGLGSARYLNFALTNSLVWVYYNAKQFKSALDLCDSVLAVFPSHRIFRQAKMHILYKIERFEEALNIAFELLEEYKGMEELPSNYTAIKSKIALIYYSMGRRDKADPIADALLSREYNEYIQMRLKRDFYYLKKCRNRQAL